jgi:hypothetical protein
LTKWIWKLVSGSTETWYKILEAKYIRGTEQEIRDQCKGRDETMTGREGRYSGGARDLTHGNGWACWLQTRVMEAATAIGIANS